MKFVTTSVLLGCAAATFLAASQFKSFDNDLQDLPMIRDAAQTASRICDPFTLFPNRHSDDLLPSGASASQSPGTKIDLPKSETLKLIDAAAQRHNVPPAFVKSIVAAESNFDCNAVSAKGAIGLMQLMPETAEQFGADPTVPEQNIEAGTHYLRVLMNRYSRSRSALKRVIAAYNAGPTIVDRYRGIPPFRETRQYVARVLNFLREFEGS
jgi:soluble lytic murein transglycosylase-like protein